MADTSQGLSDLGDVAVKLQAAAAGSDPTTGLGSLLGNMSMTAICINILAGLIGTAYFMYGRKTCNIKIVCWGVALCVVPCFIGNTILLTIACIAMAAAPFVI
ncbi:hypothetical protein OR1_00872 [Geobacter sp. OR-1]|uniref:hypothetical protein n=1 Tax=Geobacter sp. OR-1 TaxID=1266765 RepID=UPI000543301F|nr:hypothetical protein [Geobacter sp. OR-1]GAM08600.1 hypothetical protein OR1_00872 [Geobacter sp. OR-1]